MKNKLLKTLTLILSIALSLFIFVACEKPDDLGSISFKTFSVEGKSVTGMVDFHINEFSFENEIEIEGNASYKIYTDADLTNEVEKNKAILNEGKNLFYVKTNADITYTVIIIRMVNYYEVNLQSSSGDVFESQIVKQNDCAVMPEKPGYFTLSDYDWSLPVTKDLNITVDFEKIFIVESDVIVGLTEIGKTVSDLKIPAAIDGEKINKIGDLAFSDGDDDFYHETISRVEIEEGITEIGRGAFMYNTSITEVDLPNSISDIKEAAFGCCFNLQSIVLPDNLTVLDSGVFGACVKLKKVKMPKNLTEIKDNVFSNCWSLYDIEIPNGVKNIGYNAFNRCLALSTITIPESVENINSSSFYYCGKLVEVINRSKYITATRGKTGNVGCYALSVVNGYTPYKSKIITNDDGLVVYDDGEDKILVNYIGQDSFVIIPDDITEIKDFAFFYSNIEVQTLPEFEIIPLILEVSIGNGVKKIGESAFEGCGLLQTVTLGANVQIINDDAFGDCNSLIKVINKSKYIQLEKASSNYGGVAKNAQFVISDFENVENENGNFDDVIGDEDGFVIRAVGNNKILHKYNGNKVDVVIPQGVTKISSTAFLRTEIKSVIIPNSVTSIGSAAFAYCSELESVIIPNSVTSIGDAAFAYSGISSVKLSQNLTEIKRATFAYCSNLTEITIFDKVKLIEDAAFAYCSELESVIIPNSVTSIGSATFYSCSKLNNITIPDSVKTIAEYAFTECNLKKLILGANVTSLKKAFYRCAIEEVESKAVIKYSSYGLILSSESEHLNRYDNNKIITTDDGFIIYTEGNQKKLIGYIGSNKNVIIPEEITTIADSAFDGVLITSVTIPDSVKIIEKFAFYNCRSLKSIEFGTGVEIIGSNAFGYCTSLKSINIPDNVIVIKLGAFHNCDKLENIQLGTGLERIGVSAFLNCVEIEAINFNGTAVEWNSIFKESMWINNTSVTKVVCIDGEVTI